MAKHLDTFFSMLSSSSSFEGKPFPETGEGEAAVLRARLFFQWGGSISVMTVASEANASVKGVFLCASVDIDASTSSSTKASLLVCCLISSLPTALFNILRGQFGYWVSFLAVVAHHFFPQKFPVSGFLLFVVTPNWVAHELHDSILGGILCLIIGVSLLIYEIRDACKSDCFDRAWYCYCVTYSISMLFLIYSTILYLRF